jgi:hypothetical protein
MLIVKDTLYYEYHFAAEMPVGTEEVGQYLGNWWRFKPWLGLVSYQQRELRLHLSHRLSLLKIHDGFSFFLISFSDEVV